MNVANQCQTVVAPYNQDTSAAIQGQGRARAPCRSQFRVIWQFDQAFILCKLHRLRRNAPAWRRDDGVQRLQRK